MTNTYGLDVDYFVKRLSRILRGAYSFTPDEMARECARMSVAASDEVLREAEFTRHITAADVPQHIRDEIAAEAIERALDGWNADWSFDYNEGAAVPDDMELALRRMHADVFRNLDLAAAKLRERNK